MISNAPGTCDLCGLVISGQPIIEQYDGMEKHFCCEGCARVYDIAAKNGMLEQVTQPAPAPKINVRELVLNRGETTRFSIEGMWCPGCSTAAEQVLKHQSGVKGADVSFTARLGRLEYDPDTTKPEEVLKQLEGFGYKVQILGTQEEKQTEKFQERIEIQLIAAVTFGMWVMYLYLVQLYPFYNQRDFQSIGVVRTQYVAWAMTTPVLFLGGISFLRGAWRSLRAGVATMDTLIALGTVSAYVYSVYSTLTESGETYFDSVAMITTFVMIGRTLEALGGERARKDIERLYKLQPEKAWQRVENSWKQVFARHLEVGDTILIKPGERVPADVSIIEGEAYVNETLLTGEAIPVIRGPGADLFAGTVVEDGPVVGKVIQAVGNTRLAQITKLVENTLSSKLPIQHIADKASVYFTVGILITAFATFFGWWLAGKDPRQALLMGVAVLVVACPCALGLATPLAITIALGQTTRSGLLVRNPAVLETANRVQRFVFDKTGTLTQGRMRVAQACADQQSGMTETEIVCRAAAVEQTSTHPIAQAIHAACPGPYLPVNNFYTLRGFGAKGKISGEQGGEVLVGSAQFIGLPLPEALQAEAHSHTQQGETVIWVSQDQKVLGFIVLHDPINPSAGQAVKQLKDLSIAPVILSGDNPVTVKAVGIKSGIDEFEGLCTPTKKAEKIKSWQMTGEVVGMVGDGVNDAPALAQADLSITAEGGTDLAGATSDLLMTSSDLTLLPWFIQLSKRVRRTIYLNFGWALLYNLVAIPLAITGFISPVLAALTMSFSSVLVVANSLRLRK